METAIGGLILIGIIIMAIVALNNEFVCESILLLLFTCILGAIQLFILLSIANSLYVLDSLVMLIIASLVIIAAELAILIGS